MLLRLNEPIRAAASVAWAKRDPFAGSPAYAVDYAFTANATPSWPLLHAGFIGKSDGNSGLIRLGIELPGGAQGGPVFDAAGHVAGIALRGADGQDRLLPVSAFRGEFTELLGPVAEPSSAKSRPAEAIYESAMPVSLQVIVTPDSRYTKDRARCQR